MDYTVSLGIITLVLVGMNLYVKRGVQANLKQMTDGFLSSEQLDTSTPLLVKTEQTSVSDYLSIVNSALHTSGGVTQQIYDERYTAAASRTYTSDVPYVNNYFTPAEDGDVPVPEYRDDVTQEELDEAISAETGAGG